MVKKVLNDMVMAIKVEKEVQKENVSAGGILLPDSHGSENDSADTVEVIHVGKGVEEIEVGDKVLIQPYGNNEVTIKGKKVIIFRESVAICVLDE